jgi:hypothetical protein
MQSALLLGQLPRLQGPLFYSLSESNGATIGPLQVALVFAATRDRVIRDCQPQSHPPGYRVSGLTWLSTALRTRANDISRSRLAPIKQVSFGSFPCRTQKMNCAELEAHF